MTKHLSIAAVLVIAAACKTDAPASSEDKTRSAKIEVKPVQAAAPTPAPALPPANDPAPEQAPAPPPEPEPVAPPPPAPVAAPTPEDLGLADEDELRGRNVWRKRKRLDTNHDGKLSPEEIAADTQARMTAAHTRLDTDGDGRVSPEELAAAPGRIHFDHPESLDTNRDGDISPDELAAGLKARREQRGIRR